MNRKSFLKYLKDPQQLNDESIKGLTEMVHDFPYFQSARILLLLNFHEEKHFRFDDELKTTAIFANSRILLKRHIENMDLQASPVLIPDEVVEKQTENEIITKIVPEDKPPKAENKEEDNKSQRPVIEIIDEFIKNEPSISRSQARFFNPTEAAKTSVVDDENIVSETLARIYFDQGKFEKALSIYKKLSLKFPEKSSYFAALILKAEEELKK